MENWEKVLFIALAIAIVSLFFMISDSLKDEKLCKSNGFTDFNYDRVEDGYVKCCKEVYENHLRVENYCEVFKR